jgi:hypothetical protein
MSQVALKDWLALLSEAGVKFSSVNGLRGAVESAAQRIDILLEASDLTSLNYLEDALCASPEPNRDFGRMIVCHIPQLEEIPSKPIPEGGPGGVGEVRALRFPDPVAATAASTLPPWGRMDEKLESLLGQAVVPIDWSPPDGSPVTMTKWKQWRAELITGIDTMLWPAYEKTGASWSSPAVAKLLDADFKLLSDLHENLGLPIKSRYPTKVVHNDLFLEEDDASIEFGSHYERYDPKLPPHCLKDFTNALIAGMADKVGTLDLQLKQVFQRPRAYQVAFLQNRTNFSYRWARTGGTPSLVSGHSLQASIAGCTAYAAFAAEMTDRSMELLGRFTVDVGDRRVFAGVHYPSDNLASWYVALKLVPCVFDGERAAAVRHFLWSAISKGLVFLAVSAYADADGNSPYKKIVEEIRRLGSADR